MRSSPMSRAVSSARSAGTISRSSKMAGPRRWLAFRWSTCPFKRLRPSTSDLQPIEPDVSTNAGGLQGGLYLIVLDDVHTDLVRTALVKAAARRFIERLADTDLAAVVTTSGRFEAVQDFTSNRRLLLAAVDTFVGQKLRSSVLEKLDSYRQEMDRSGQDLGQLGKPVNDSVRRSARPAGTQYAAHPQEPRGVAVGRARPAQGHGVHQRGDRLHDRQLRSVAGDQRKCPKGCLNRKRSARRDYGRFASECQHLQHRSPWAHEHGGHGHRDQLRARGSQSTSG